MSSNQYGKLLIANNYGADSFFHSESSKLNVTFLFCVVLFLISNLVDIIISFLKHKVVKEEKIESRKHSSQSK